MQDSSAVGILLVDDYEPFRRFLSAALKKSTWQVIGEASDGLAAIQKAKDLKLDLILLDVGLPKLNGIEAAHLLSRVVPDAKILFISQNNNANVVAAALSNGAKGYVYKQTVNTELLPALKPFCAENSLSVKR